MMTMQQFADATGLYLAQWKNGLIYAYTKKPLLNEAKGYWEKEEDEDVYFCLNDCETDEPAVMPTSKHWTDSLNAPSRKIKEAV